MMKYVLTSEEARKNVDLNGYGQIIFDAVCDVIADDEPLVTIDRDYYCVETDIPMTENKRVQIDEVLCLSELGKYRIEGQMLFTGIRVEEDHEDAK